MVNHKVFEFEQLEFIAVTAYQVKIVSSVHTKNIFLESNDNQTEDRVESICEGNHTTFLDQVSMQMVCESEYSSNLQYHVVAGQSIFDLELSRRPLV